MKDDESSIRSGPTCYTGDPLASDLGNRSAAGTDWEWATTKIWARLRDLVSVITTSKLSVRTDFDLARQSRHSLAPTTSKAMSAITNLSDKHVEDIKAGRSDRNLWIYGYDLSVDEEGPAVARLKKIIRGLRDLTMVDEEALRAHEHPVATVRQLEGVKGKIMFMLNHPASKALALKVEEAVLAVGKGTRETPMSKWHGRGIALTNDGGPAAAGQPVRYGGGLIATAKPQWVNRKWSSAVGQTEVTPCALKASRETHGVASTTRLRGGGPIGTPIGTPNYGDERPPAGIEPWAGVEGAWGRPRETSHQRDDRLDGWGQPRQRQRLDAPEIQRTPPALQPSPCYSAKADDQPNGWGRMLTTTNGYLHHVREWHDPATWGVVENSWRGGRLDEAGKIRYGWGNVAETFGEDPRWTDYIAEVRRGTSLTWKQYTAALEENALNLQRPQQVAAERVYIKAQPMYIRFPRGEKTLLVSFAAMTVGELISEIQNSLLADDWKALVQGVGAAPNALRGLVFKSQRYVPGGTGTEKLLSQIDMHRECTANVQLMIMPFSEPPAAEAAAGKAAEEKTAAGKAEGKALANARPGGHANKKALKMQEHKRRVARASEADRAKEALASAGLQRQLEQKKRKLEADDCNAMARRWRDNRGEAVRSVPLLPPDLWAHILQQGQEERAQREEWVAWANRELLQRVVVWFRTGGQRDSAWLGRLINKGGRITTSDTDNIAKRFRPWCRSILQPGKQNDPLHYSGMGGAPANFVSVYTHMLSMMDYVGFDNVIERLQRILRMLAQCVRPASGLPKYIPGPPDSDDEEDDWEDDVPEPGPRPPWPRKTFVQRRLAPNSVPRAWDGR